MFKVECKQIMHFHQNIIENKNVKNRRFFRNTNHIIKKPPPMFQDGGEKNKPMSNYNISQFTGIAKKNRQNYFPGDSCVSFFDCTLICP